jgi:hypothetical protein
MESRFELSTQKIRFVHLLNLLPQKKNIISLACVISMLCCSYRYTAEEDRTISSFWDQAAATEGHLQRKITGHLTRTASLLAAKNRVWAVCQEVWEQAARLKPPPSSWSSPLFTFTSLPKGIQHQHVSGQCPRGQYTDDRVQLRTKRRQLVGDVRAEVSIDVSNVSTNR